LKIEVDKFIDKINDVVERRRRRRRRRLFESKKRFK
jgi:hypothetical protein